MGVTVEAQGLKEIRQMFDGLPKRVNKDLVWGRFWKKVTVPLLDAAIKEAPIADRDVVYPPDSNLKIARGTLKESLIFFRTSASRKKDVHGAYVGPRVKGKYKKNMGGYYGAWVEYGHRNRDGSMSKPNPFMKRAWDQTSNTVLNDGFSAAEQIFVKAVAADVRRMKKYGALGY